jgi:aspartyl-tRNA(Asn)/glutamyl-tRNA(Gln) amidotransferase subunit B
MRSKEESHDYRYFPDPDLLPVIVSEEWKNKIVNYMPELPKVRKQRFINDYKIPEYDSEILTSSKELADYYENVLRVTDDYKSASNWVMGDILKVINENKISITEFIVSPDNIGKLINLINNKTISTTIGKEVFAELLKENKDPQIIINEKNLVQISDSSQLETIIDEIIASNEKQVEEYRNGKEKVLGFLVGQIMRETKGKANPQVVNEILMQKLKG